MRDVHRRHQQRRLSPLSPPASDLRCCCCRLPPAAPRGPGPGPGGGGGPAGPGPGPGHGRGHPPGQRDRPRPRPRPAVGREGRAASAAADMNDTELLQPLANLSSSGSSLGLDAEELDALEGDGGALGVAEQLLIAWRHIIGGPNASVDVGLGLLHVSLNASGPASSGPDSNLSASSLAGNASAGQLGALGLGGYMELGNASTWRNHDEELVHLMQMVGVAVLLGLVILATVIGKRARQAA
ncbi:5-hydroxytryptamine receptor 2A [Frankliniella fusca]|uniref:5-hydroxytryptamine receptor 2A n=1 Tax=Frankliniella fusca TaxID=407009 RepID=A0AAE1HE86_9NEOP|nr:5-hydroxytryptamine receptor 2A [Frankliniella fusca]